MNTTDSRPDHDSPTLLGLGSSDVLGPTRGWRDMGSAPLDGTLVQLLVRFDHNNMEDTNDPAATVGSCNGGEWNFVGWCWHTDEWARGSGDLLGWLPVGPNVS